MSSGQGYGSAYNAPQDGFPSTNPWADQVPQSTNQQQQQQQQAQPRPSGYEPPPGPPPRGNTFNEESFVPEDQRGEQREALVAIRHAPGGVSHIDDLAGAIRDEQYEAGVTGRPGCSSVVSRIPAHRFIPRCCPLLRHSISGSSARDAHGAGG